MNPYQAKADELDEKIRSMYPNGNEPDLTPEDNNDLSLDAESNPVDDSGGESATPAAEETVPKSQYDAAVKAMNAAQRELAESRKQQSSSESSEEMEDMGDMMGDNEEANEEGNETAGNQDFESIIANLEDLGFDDFTPALRYLKDKIDALGGVADDYIGYRKQQHTDAFWGAIREAHPDIQSFIPPSDADYESYTDEQKEYADWYAEQDQETKDLFASDDPAVVIQGLDMFRSGGEAMQDEEQETDSPAVVAMVATEKPSKKIEQAKAVAAPSIAKGGDKASKFNGRISTEEWHKLSREDRDAYNRYLDEQMASK
jgi:hypothetical protein